MHFRELPRATHASLDNIGRARAGLLRDRDAGFYVQDRLDRQYLFLNPAAPPSAGPPRSGSIKLNPLREVNW